MEYPDIIDFDFASLDGSPLGSNQRVRNIIDFAVSEHRQRNARLERMQDLYDAHNGIIGSDKAMESITKTTGKKSKTKYTKYRLGRSKIKLVHGEFLQMNIGASVHTLNREARNKKAQKYMTMLGMGLVKPELEKVRELGYDVFPGMKIPDPNDKKIWTADRFKTTNEKIIQKIIDDKVENESLKRTYHANFVDMTIVSEMFGKIEKDSTGKDTLRYINPQNALFLESLYDPLLERTPYFGEVHRMYYHEVLTNPEIKLTETQRSQLIAIKEDPQAMADNPDIKYINRRLVFNVYTLQFKSIETVYLKTIQDKDSDVPYLRYISNDFYKKNEAKIKREVAAGKYTISPGYRGRVWQAHRIGENMYTPATLVTNMIQLKDSEGKYKPEFDYCGFLFSTINGTRISLQEIITELERIYDDIRFQINRELRRIKGSVLFLDEAFYPRGSKYTDIIHSITEDGIVRINSSAEGNEGNIDAVGQSMMKAFDLGGSRGLMSLLNHAMDIERTIDRITGINDDRQGLTRATTTATTNVNNLEASRSMTYDMFFFIGDYIRRTLLKLAAKTKLNYAILKEDQREFILSDDEIKFLEVTSDLSLDDFGIVLTDGKREREVLSKIELMFPAEINAGLLSAVDVAKFYMQSSFAKAVQILDEARAASRAFQLQQIELGNKAKEKQTDTSYKIAREDREDRQDHEKELELIKIEGKKELESMKGGIKGGLETQKQEFEQMTGQQDTADESLEIPELESM